MFELTAEMRQELKDEIIELLTEYDYEVSEKGVDKILDEWARNKGELIEMMMKHPNYNGKFQIVFSDSYSRGINGSVINEFCDLMKEWYLTHIYDRFAEPKYENYTFKEITDAIIILDDKINRIERLRVYPDLFALMESEYGKLSDDRIRFNDYCDKIGHVMKVNGYYVYASAYSQIKSEMRVIEYLYQFLNSPAMTEVMVDYIKGGFPELKIAVGQKTSRAIRALCKEIGFDNAPNFNEEFPKFGDAINPLKIKRHTIISAHPVDYYTMSFGNSWASCHTIDKTNRRGMDHSYQGCYSAGTESYMLDPTSLVFYTVDEKYTGDKFELEPKINRNMIHVVDGMFVQGRIYPQSTDRCVGTYEEVRAIEQKVLAECMGIPNYWTKKAGTNACCEVIESRGVHYRDYASFDDCNVNRAKDRTEFKRIIVGHDPICPSCGKSHYNNDWITCNHCTDGRVCSTCRCESNDLEEIDGEWYCPDCRFTCDDCGSLRPISERIIVVNGNWVCEHCVNENYNRCERCGEYVYVEDDDVINTADGSFYCCSDCAEADGYVYVDRDGDWHHEDYVTYCGVCDEYVLNGDYNEEHHMCVRCWENEREEEEA